MNGFIIVVVSSTKIKTTHSIRHIYLQSPVDSLISSKPIDARSYEGILLADSPKEPPIFGLLFLVDSLGNGTRSASVIDFWLSKSFP